MRWLDHAYVRLVPRLRCFSEGWGDEAILALTDDRSWAELPRDEVDIRWSRSRVHGELTLRDGSFESRDEALPLESRRAAVRWVAPRHAPPRAVVVVLAAWGGETFDARMSRFGAVARQGIALLMLEQPLYGGRRRVGQRGTNLLTVSDFVLMGRATMRESRALVSWARRQGHASVGVAGFSMGGQLAAMTAAIVEEPTPVAAIAPSMTPATVFVDGPLRQDVDWARLGPGALPRLRRVLGALDVLSLPPPKDPSLARLVGTRRDVFVRPGDVGAIARHWGVQPRWVEDGHVSVATLRRGVMAQAVLDAFA